MNAADQTSEIEIASFAPRGVQQIREQHVFTARNRIAVDAEQGEHAGGGGVHPFLHRFTVVADDRRRCDERLEQRQRPAGGAAWRVDGDIGGVDEALNARAVFAPAGESVFPERRLLLGKGLGGESGIRRLLRIDPRAEIGRRERGKSQGEVAEIAFRVDRDDGDVIDQRFFDEPDAETGLAATGHADDHGMRGEILGVVQHVVVLTRAGGKVVAFAEIQRAEGLEVGHRQRVERGAV